jgi:hypothetical protein
MDAKTGESGIHGDANAKQELTQPPFAAPSAGTLLCEVPESRALCGHEKLRQHGVSNRWREEKSIARRE